MSQPEFNLTSEEMGEVAQVFIDSVEHILKNFTPEAQQSLNHWLAEWVMKHRPYLMLTEDGLRQVTQLVWSDRGVSDFVMTLAYTFFARWGHSSVKVQGLAANLARGVALVERSSQDNRIPAEAGDRLTDINTASRVIAANKWLMIVLMIPLFVNVNMAAPQPKK